MTRDDNGFVMKSSMMVAGLIVLALAAPGIAQSAPRAEGMKVAQAQTPALGEETGKRKSRRGERASKREPTINQMAVRERQRKCSAEWKEAKAAGKTEGQKWPKFWSQCNARLKGKTV